MSNVVDNLAAFKILYMLVTPFEKTEAYKRGVIDKDGNVLVKSKDQTSEQKDAYDVLDRLVFSLKRLLGKIPGGKSQIASLAAAYYLIKESYENDVKITEEGLIEMIKLIDSGFTLVEEQILIEEFVELLEDGIANVTGPAIATDIPAIRVGKNGRKFGTFAVPDHVFRRFSKGKKKFTKWADYLDVKDEEQEKIYSFAKKNPKGVVILKHGDMTKAIRYNRNGGGKWHKLTRKPKQLQEELYVEVL